MLFPRKDSDTPKSSIIKDNDIVAVVSALSKSDNISSEKFFFNPGNNVDGTAIYEQFNLRAPNLLRIAVFSSGSPCRSGLFSARLP